MKSKTYKILLACFVLIFAANLRAQQDPAPIHELLLNYLTGYCDEGEKNTFIDFIRKNANVVEPLLVNYVQKGIPESLVDSLKTNTVKQYDERQKLISRDLNFGLSKEDMDSVKKESQEDYTNRIVQEFRDGFMSQAIFGLSLIDSNEAQTLVKKIAADKNNPYQKSAQNAVNQVYLKQ